MNFDFSPEQKAFQDQVRRLLSKVCPPEMVRDVAEGRQRYAADAWTALGALGALGPHLPEEFGGAGLSHLELCLVAEALGYALAPTPFNSTICLAAEVIRLAGSAEQKADYLPRLAGGGMIACACLDASGTALGLDAPVRASDEGLVGMAPAVPWGAVADLAVLLLPEPNTSHARSLVMVDLRQKAVVRRSVDSIDLLEGRADLCFEGAHFEHLGCAGDGASLAGQVVEQAGVMLAFEQLGGAQRCLDMAREYALARKAFGRPIGSFQAVKHKLVDIYSRLRLATGHARYAAWALSACAPDWPLAAASAHVAASEAFNFAAQENIQVHGGIGFTWEHDCHLLYRRARALALSGGSLREARDRIADLIIAE
jgi:alkylation response protein AidB-like acyl-CoA dehydrogenase